MKKLLLVGLVCACGQALAVTTTLPLQEEIEKQPSGKVCIYGNSQRTEQTTVEYGHCPSVKAFSDDE